MARVIVATTPQTGHVLPVLSLLPAVREAGYEVTFITGSAPGNHVRRAGIRHVALQGRADYDAWDVNSTFPERRSIAPGPELLDYDFRKLFIEPMIDQARTVQTVLAESAEPAMLVCNHMFTGSWPFALGMPGPRPSGIIALGITPMMASDPALAPFGPGLPPATDETQRCEYALMKRALDEGPLRHSKAMLAASLKALGARHADLSFLDATTLLPDQFLQLTVPGLEYPRTNLRSARMIGAAPVPLQPFQQPDWWPQVVKTKAEGKPVVFVTQGTVARDLDALVYPAMTALANLDGLVVATAGKVGDRFLDDMPANARLTDYLPYEQILPYANAVVTNGGYGGVQQTLRHGVPLVMAGTSEDKAEVAARVEWAGAGINLKTDRPSVHSIQAAVQFVLRNEAMKQAATALQQQYRDADPVAELERTIAAMFSELSHGSENQRTQSSLPLGM